LFPYPAAAAAAGLPGNGGEGSKFAGPSTAQLNHKLWKWGPGAWCNKRPGDLIVLQGPPLLPSQAQVPSHFSQSASAHPVQLLSVSQASPLITFLYLMNPTIQRLNYVLGFSLE
jgi:hypothetical protein